ncbi:MAG: hypothetical protein DDT26_00045 [Dehalococcoidia bacterium]|nr:hypothetical protein [Chloroflexota bacterium]
MRLGRFFTLAELTFSQTAARRGLDNSPSPEVVANLRALVQNVLDPLRVSLGSPVVISSGYRSRAVNEAIGGSLTSQHMFGQAADFTVPGKSVAEIINHIQKINLPFDQLIDEFGRWIHVSHGPRNRRQVLRARRVGGRTTYEGVADAQR